MVGVPCWEVHADYGSWLSFQFGKPRLEIREARPRSRVVTLKRRRVFVLGSSELRIEMAAWRLLRRGRLECHSDLPRSSLRKAAVQLAGQKITAVKMRPDNGGLEIRFEYGHQLLVAALGDAKRDDPLWHLRKGRRGLTMTKAGPLLWTE